MDRAHVAHELLGAPGQGTMHRRDLKQRRVAARRLCWRDRRYIRQLSDPFGERPDFR